MSPSWNLEQGRTFCTACQQITPAFVEKLVSLLNLCLYVLIYWETCYILSRARGYFMLRIVYFRLDAAKCISESGDGELD